MVELKRNKLKIAVCSVVYNEIDYIGACLRNWKGIADKHLVLVNTIPWNGSPATYDGTVEMARKWGGDVIVGFWNTEAEQRNFGLARLYDYDFVLIVDPDELYEHKDQEKIIEFLGNNWDEINRTPKKMDVFVCSEMITYWKTPEWVFAPADKHKPCIAVDPKQIRFYEHRQTQPFSGSKPYNDSFYTIPVKCHHFSWAKSDAKVKEKISSFSHAEQIRPNWYDEVWLKWTPEMENIRPYGVEKSKAIRQPAPQELMDLL